MPEGGLKTHTCPACGTAGIQGDYKRVMPSERVCPSTDCRVEVFYVG